MTGRARPARPSRDPKARPGARSTGLALEPLRPAAAAALLAWSLLLLLAPPASNGFWAVNGLRSLPTYPALAVLGAALASALPALLCWRGRWRLLAIPLALTLSFALREHTHFLGDTHLRIRALSVAGVTLDASSFASLTARLHAAPLDVAVNVMMPLLLESFGMPVLSAVSCVSAVLAWLYFAGIWRATGFLVVALENRLALAWALALTGTLEALAGYPESGGLMAVTAIWWGAEMLAPLDRPRQALRLSLALLAALLSHRLALALLAPHLWRLLRATVAGDRAPVRRRALVLGAAALALAVAVSILSGAASRLHGDLEDLFDTLRAGGWRGAAPSDIANTLALVAPLAILAPVLAGGATVAAFLRQPAAQWIAIAAAPLLAALVWLFPLGQEGLGALRDWDANILLGSILVIAAGAFLAPLPAATLRTVLAATTPVLALGALGWVAANANPETVTRRAIVLAVEPSTLTPPQQSAVFAWLGQRAMDERRPDLAAPRYEQAFAFNPNPRLSVLAAEAWLLSGDLSGARRSLAAARARSLTPELTREVEQLEAGVARAAGDSAAAAPAYR